MNSREKLTKELSVIIREAFQRGFDSESVSELDNFDGFAEADDMLNQYTIGRWVSVDERLPEFKGDFWSGFILQDGITLYVSRSECALKTPGFGITHWLELDLQKPNEKGE